MEGTDLWLAASGDQRVSIWASDWAQDHCELLDWLSFPAPATLEVKVMVVHGRVGNRWGPHTLLQHAVPSVGTQPPSSIPCCLLPLG